MLKLSLWVCPSACLCGCIIAGFFASGWAGAVLYPWGVRKLCDGRWTCPFHMWPLITPNACQEVKGKTMAVNEAEYTSAIDDDRMEICEEVMLLHPCRWWGELWCVWVCGEFLWTHWVCFGVVTAVCFLWDCLWTSSGGQRTSDSVRKVGTGWRWCGCSMASGYLINYFFSSSLHTNHVKHYITLMKMGGSRNF